MDTTPLITSGASAVAGPFINNANATLLGGTLAFGGPVDGAGSFIGSGTAVFDGGYSPGNSAAQVSLRNARLGPSNTLAMELGGASRGTQCDALTASGELDLDGVLKVTLLNGFVPQVGQSFDLLDWGAETGTFSDVSLPALAPGLAWDRSQLNRTGVLSVSPVPEPGSLALVVLAAAGGVAFWRRRARRANVLPRASSDSPPAL